MGRLDRAGDVRGIIEPRPPANGPRRFEPLPELVPAPEAPDPAESPEGAAEAEAARAEAAEAFSKLSDRAFDANRLALADSCLRAVLRRRPDDPEARRLLGYVPHDGGWATPHAIRELDQGKTLHPIYGWIPTDDLPKLDRGLLPAPRSGRGGAPRWLPAEEADAMRLGSIERGWQITTTHFEIRASVGLDEAIAFGRRLEDFFDLFTSVAADLIGPSRLPLARLQRTPGAVAEPLAPRRHRVDYFGSKQQYIEYLAPHLGADIDGTLGIYLDDQRVSYSFKDDAGQISVEATLYHEVSHQLLFELAGRTGYQRNAGNYWVFEGLGTYFETVTPRPDGSIQFGGPVGRRFEEAKRRIIEVGQFVPTAELVTFDRDTFNARDNEGDVYLNYAEAMALATFLMDADRGIRRDGFLDYAADAYNGRLRGGFPTTLFSSVGLNAGDLDQELRAFLRKSSPSTIDSDAGIEDAP